MQESHDGLTACISAVGTEAIVLNILLRGEGHAKGERGWVRERVGEREGETRDERERVCVCEGERERRECE